MPFEVAVETVEEVPQPARGATLNSVLLAHENEEKLEVDKRMNTSEIRGR